MSQPRDVMDTHLLRVLETVLTECSVTRAALKLNQSQPAVSAALRRLRVLTGDPLLVRGKVGMVPTEHGIRLLAPARRALGEIDQIVSQQSTFDPATSVRTYRLACPDYLSSYFVPGVVASVRRLSPAASVEVHSLGPLFDYEQALAEGKIDVVVGNWPEPPEQLRLSRLFADEIVCLVSAGHPLADRDVVSVSEYLSALHLAPTPYSVGQRGAIDVHLARERVKRNVVVTLPYFGLAPYVVAATDLMFTTTRRFAEHYERILPVKMVPVALAFPAMQYYQLWHERGHHSEEIRWLRGLICSAVEAVVGNSAEGVEASTNAPTSP